jgi:hypothetical protein
MQPKERNAMLQEMTTPTYDSLIREDRVHVSLYTDPQVFEEEMEKIFHRTWVFVGHESEIPHPGDFVTRQIGRQPVIMVRGKFRTSTTTAPASRLALKC